MMPYFDGEDVHNLSLDRRNIEKDLGKEKDDIAKNPYENMKGLSKFKGS